MINRHLAHLWRQMKIHRILTHVCLHQIGCLCYCGYAKTSSSAVQKRHSKVYGNPIAPSFYSILLGNSQFCGYQYFVQKIRLYLVSSYSPFFSNLKISKSAQMLKPQKGNFFLFSFNDTLLNFELCSLYSINL